MSTRSKSHTKKSATHDDAIASLMADHKRVKALFKEFESLKENLDADDRKADIVKQICLELTLHAEVEEQIFYPAVRKAIDDADLMDEALVEHAGAKELIAQLQAMEPGDDLYDAKVTVLGEQIDHHVKEEEGDMFPQAKKAKLDTAQLGAEMTERRNALKTELGVEDDSAEEDDDQQPEVRSKSADVKRAHAR